MSEELLQRGYVDKGGKVRGDEFGSYESFNIGATTLRQLKAVGIVPAFDYGNEAGLKPDGLVVDMSDGSSATKLVIEYKNRGELDSERKRQFVFAKTATTYCRLLRCPLAAVSDGSSTSWLLADLPTLTWRLIEREDGYPLDLPVELATPDGRRSLAELLDRIDREMDTSSGRLRPPEPVNPTKLAEQTWQTIWLASGENPDACLASFVEVLLFKFLSDLGILTTDPTGSRVDFDHVAGLPAGKVLKYYFDFVRPEIKRLFPAGTDETSVINGIVLDPANVDHGRLFLQILSKFHAEGVLKRIDPEFKSRIFERFLKKSISQKNWGQFFTPRNVVKAMVEMSGIEHLAPGAVVADPACGVGGFLLEPLLHKRPHDFREANSPSLSYKGYDRDQKTVILAKANMLIHLSQVLENDPRNAPTLLAPVLNETFTSVHHSITGSLSLIPRDAFDLLMTNPPYVVTGTSTQRAMIAEDPALAAYYDIGGSGVENLFLQLIINGLKPGARALVIVPDGLLLRHSEESLKRHLLDTCSLEALISLPKNTFYSTPKKTYVIVFRKKQVPGGLQTDPVFTYLVTNVGETRDAKRFPTEANDLPRMAESFKLFQGSPAAYLPPENEPRLRIYRVDEFKPEEHWLVDRWWSEEERVALGELESSQVISPEDLAQRLRDVAATMEQLADVASERTHLQPVRGTKTVSLGDPNLFRISIGKRVLTKDLYGKPEGSIPLYSANVLEPFGHIETSNLTDFSRPSVLFGIDGNFELAVKEAEVPFAITDHCGRIEILDDRLNAAYCRAAIALARVHGFDRTLRPSQRRIKKLTFAVPVDDEDRFDLEAQLSLAARYDSIVETLRDAEAAFDVLTALQPDVMLHSDPASNDVAGSVEQLIESDLAERLSAKLSDLSRDTERRV